MVSSGTCFLVIFTLALVSGKPMEYQSASLQAMPPGVLLIPTFEGPVQEVGHGIHGPLTLFVDNLPNKAKMK